jgi:hypothetical protein
MRAKKRQSLLAVILMLGIGIPGSIGIFAVQAKAVPDQPVIQEVLQAADTATPTMTATLLPVASSTATLRPSGDVSSPTGPGSARLYAYVQAPSGALERPYVILKAFSAPPRAVPLSIRGFVDSQEFICPSDSCVMHLDGNARFVFRAYSEDGLVSDEVISTVDVTRGQDGFFVTINTVSQFTTFVNACSNLWGIYDETNVTWDDFVQFPHELNTRKTLHSLATQLLLNGIVDASDCPAGGLSVSLDWPTACGLERATPKMIEWQNQYDDYIWLASRDVGIPPKLIKTLIEVETQFWPGNSRFYLDEYGLGQVSQLGMDILLRRDPAYYQQVCSTVLLPTQCASAYVSLSPEAQAMIRGAAVRQMDATCPSCDYGLDLNRAKESVSLIAKVLRANCEQVDYIMSLAVVERDEDADQATATAAVATLIAGGDTTLTSYEDMWRFTFLAYHSGLSCFQQAVTATKRERLPVNWENVAGNLTCRGGEDYTNAFMDNLFAFDFYRYESNEQDVVIPASTIIPTWTPPSTSTPFISTAQVRVQVFMDRNGNQQPDPGEWIDAMSVQLDTSNNEQITQRTQEGIAVFDMSGFTPGIGITVSLPGLYRSESFVLPEQGEVLVTFMFEQPVLPTSLP